MKRLLILICGCLLFAACGGPKGFTLKYKGKDVPFEKKMGASSFRPDLGEGQIALLNYDIEIKDKSVMGIRDPDQPGQVLIGIYFKNNNGADRNNSIKPGDVSDKIKYIWFANGDTKDRVTFGENATPVNGKLVITEVTDDLIKGEIDVKKDGTSITGPFEAKIISRHL